MLVELAKGGSKQTAGTFTVGIEEEYFLADAQTFAAPSITPEALFIEAGQQAAIGREMLQSQLEVQTSPHISIQSAKDELIQLRQAAANAARQHGFVIIAAGTHPTANWRRAVQSPKERYDKLIDGLQMIGQRNMLCGMHVHVEVPDASQRVGLMRRIVPFLPLFLALSTSSPFWRSELTGLKGYRLAAYDEMPRTGIPDQFSSIGEYNTYVQALTQCGAIDDPTHLWWAIRPSHRYPTIELRITDCCTRISDSIALGALFRSLVRYLVRNPHIYAEIGPVDRAIAVENKWRAQRYGVSGTFVSQYGSLSIAECLERMIDQVHSDAHELGCDQEIIECRDIIRNGTSADTQIQMFESETRGQPEALQSVMTWLSNQTVSS